MFIQVFHGMCSRQDELRALGDEWVRELSRDADGWLGSTHGFTDEGRFIGVVRFESREAAMANSQRPEQGAWAERMGKLIDGEVSFEDYDDVDVLFDGGSDEAGFVQVIQGRVDDVARLRRLLALHPDELRAARPEIIGATLATTPEGRYTQTVAFTDEASARRGEQQEPPADVATELRWAMQGATFHDLHDPMLLSPVE